MARRAVGRGLLGASGVGLGVSAASAPTAGLRARSLGGFRIAAQQRSPFNRAMALRRDRAGRLLAARPDEGAARHLLADCAAALKQSPGDLAWPWIEPRLRYANAAIAEALITAGSLLDRPLVLERGLELLEFLLDAQTAAAGHLSVVPVGGRGPDEIGPDFDQQPIEVAALAEACRRGSPRHLRRAMVHGGHPGLELVPGRERQRRGDGRRRDRRRLRRTGARGS